MKRAFLLPLFLCLLAIPGFAQAVCEISGTLYRINGVTPAAFGQLEIIQTVKVGATISTKKIPVRADASGLLSFSALQGSSITLKGDFYGYTRGVTVNVPNAATASLEDLVVLSTVFTTLGDLVYAGVNGVPTRLPIGSNGKVLKVNSGIPSWQTESGGGGGSLTVEEADGTPSVGSVSLLSFNQAVGFTVTDQGSDEARVSLNAVPYSALNLTASLVNADIASGAAIDALKIGGGAVSSAEFNFLDGVTSGIQAQFTAKANLASPTFTGVPAAPTAAGGTNTTQLATTQFVQSAIAGISSGVVSFNSRTGTVTPAQDDYTFSQLASIPTTLAGYGIADAQPLDSDLTALAGNSTSGLWARTGAGAGSARTITGTADVITVTNGNGVSGNPTVTIASTYAGQASIATLGTITAGAWNADAIPSQYGGTGQDFSGSTGFILATSGTFSAVAGTGSGSVVRGTAPTIAGGSVTGLTALGIRNVGTGAFDLTLASNETLTAGRTLTIVVGDTARTLTLGGNATLNGGTHSGTNTGDQTSVTGNAGTATALATARNINGVAFDGAADITVTAAAGTLSGTTLNSSVVTSSLTSVGTITSGTWTGTTIAVANGGTGITSFGTGVGTWLGTPSSANFLAAITNETGTGLVVGNDAPVIITPSFTTGFTIGGAAASRKILVGNGTNFVASTETWPVPGTSGNVLTSDGTNWTSAAPSGGGDDWDSITAPNANQALDMSTFTSAWTANTAITNTVNTLLTIGHNTSGTAAASFGTRTLYQLESSTTADQDAAAIDTYWSTATHASRTSRVAISTVNAGGTPGTLSPKVVIGNSASQTAFLKIQNRDTISSGDRAQLRLASDNMYLEGGFGAAVTLSNQDGTNIDFSMGYPAFVRMLQSSVVFFTGGGTTEAVKITSVDAARNALVVTSAASPSVDIARFLVNNVTTAGAYAGFAKGGTALGVKAAYTGTVATTTLNLANGNFQDFTFGAGNETIAVSNVPNSAVITITVIQDGTGARTITWPSTIKWAAGVAPTLTVTAAARDQFTFRSDGTNLYEIARALDVK
jgi:hypothetical protein